MAIRDSAFTILAGLLAGAIMAPHSAEADAVVREAAGADSTSIQAAVDAFRNDLGNPNNANAAGSQPSGRREINWDGGGAAASATTFPSPMTNFNTAPATRGAVFTTPGVGFEISGAPTPEFGDIEPTYPLLFATFSAPRLFTPLGSNITDVHFFVPGTSTPAAVTGFGAVFTDVDTTGSTKMEFYGPNGELLLERNVPATAGNETLSFLGVSFNEGEIVGRVRITSGNRTVGLGVTVDDVVVIDDLLYGEPVATAGLTVSPASGTYFSTEGFDLTIALVTPAGVTVVGGSATFDGVDVTPLVLSCLRFGTLVSGGLTFRCPGIRGLASGTHTFAVTVNLSDGTRVRNAVVWQVQANVEP